MRNGGHDLKRVLVVDDEKSIRVLLKGLLAQHGYHIFTATNGREGLETIITEDVDVVIADIRMPDMGGMELLEEINKLDISTTTILMTAYGSLESAMSAMKAGAYDFITKPFKNDEVVIALMKAQERENLRRENQALRRAVRGESEFEGIVARSQVMRDVFRTITKVAEYKSTVLIAGESGTGKELVAKAIHHQSPRKDRPFVAVNCGAIPETLLESELFGYKRGAFTDAVRDKTGLFEEADGGTIFLDEIGELPLALQVKLLRALQEETIRRLGDTGDTRVDVRIIAATVRDLSEDVSAGRFREDLYYRLNVLPVQLPPLSQRPEDVRILVEHFIDRHNSRLGTRIQGISADALKLMMEYSWPGNVRELENTIERAMVLAEGPRITPVDLPAKIREVRDPIRLALKSDELSIKKTSRMIEEELIRRALKQTGGNRTTAAKLLEISHRALLYKIKEYGIT